MNNFLYRFSKNFFITSEMTRKVESKISILYPANRLSIIAQTEKYLFKIYLLVISLIFILMLFAEFSIYYSVVIGIVIYALINSSIYAGLYKLELKLLYQLERFIVEIRYNYQFDGMIEESIENAINSAPFEMALHGQQIAMRLKDTYLKNIDDYKEIAPNNYFLTFYSLCLTVMKYGDKKIDDESLFLKNLACLKEDINIEILKRKKIINSFMGLQGLTILPIFTIKPIEYWALANMPELSESYMGTFGIVSTIVLSLITITVYKVIESLKLPFSQERYKSRWVEVLVENRMVNKITIKYLRATYKSSERLNKLLKSMVYPYDAKEFLVRNVVLSFTFSVLAFIVALSIGFSVSTATLIFFMSIFISFAMGYISLIVKRQIIIMNTEDEIVRFQAVILMLMYIDKISTQQLLGAVSDFAVIFKEDINGLIRGLSYKGKKIFEESKNKTQFLPFAKLLNGFIACDTLPICKAFQDIDSDRKYYIEKHRQESEEIIERKSAIAKTLAYVPLCLVIIIKLIIPFVVEGISRLSINGMQI